MRAEGVFDVDANTSIDQLSEDLDIVLPEVCKLLFTSIKFLVFNCILTFYMYTGGRKLFLMRYFLTGYTK